MNLTKTKKIIAAGLSALMMMTSTTSVFAAESGDKSTTLNYQVSSSYDWIIHSSIDFGADAGVGKTVDRTGNQVKVLKNVIPEGKYLNISVKGSGANDAFTVDNGGSEVLNYDVSDDNGAVGVNGNVLSVPAGTNTATQNMNFKLNTTKKSAEVAGQYNGRVIYNASVGDKNGGTTSGGSTDGSTDEVNNKLRNGSIINISGHKYIVVNVGDINSDLGGPYCTLMSTEKISGSTILNGKSTDGLTSYEINTLIIDYLNNHIFEIVPWISGWGGLNINSTIYSKDNSVKDSKELNAEMLYPISVQEYNKAFGSISYEINGNGLYRLLNDGKDMWSRDFYENDNGKGITYYGMSGVVHRNTRELNQSYVLPCFNVYLSDGEYSMVGDIRDRVDYFD